MLLFLAAQGCARDEEAQAGPKGGGSLQYTKEQFIFFYTTKGKDGPWMGVDFFSRNEQLHIFFHFTSQEGKMRQANWWGGCCSFSALTLLALFIFRSGGATHFPHPSARRTSKH